jgi:acetoacetate decarboxylase
LPVGVDPAPEDPGAVAIIWADWQSCADDGAELADPVRSQYKECFVVVRCSLGGEVFSRCVYIWVDKDFALARGWYQGYPKKLGSIWMTRPVTVGKAGPRLEAGGRLGATLAANDRRLAEVSLTLSGSSVTGGFVNALPMLHSRWMPSIDPSQPDALNELVTMQSQDVELGPVYTGDPTVELFDAPGDELSFLRPYEMIAGYWRQVGATFSGGTKLA